MLKSSSNTQELRLPRTEHNGSALLSNLDTLKTSFLPDLSNNMETNNIISTSTQFCPMCAQHVERQHAAEHIQQCHGIITGNSGIIMPPNLQNVEANSSKIDYTCHSCDEKFLTAQEFDEHNRIVHQATTFVARCLACGMYGVSTISPQENDEYKCLHCSSICNAASLGIAQNAYIGQQTERQNANEVPSIQTVDINSLSRTEAQRHQAQTLLQQQDPLHIPIQQPQLQQQQHQQERKSDERQEEIQRKVPPLTVKLNKNNGIGDPYPHVVVKQEPVSVSDNGSDGASTSIPVFTIQQPANIGSPTNTSAIIGDGLTTVVSGNKVRHKCADCPKTFKTPGTLAMHRKVHTGEADVTPKERPFTCSYCGKSFTQSNTLKQHTRIHTGEKPYHCGYCEKSFSVKDYLTKHIRTHTGEKPYTCPYCDKRFTQRSALTVHTTKLHPL
ncbi:chorion transcription factor Cf2 isoform X2 [Teleopsis dalmanni]|uniref:chorion transcription factor Cf2 isoform X2 n=1 Tax=Teleopsis dalmanni TaxID=139649 RepID=UPI0018CCF5DD|nr:chorion transcription factor Cf2 isoform X2 [Teleopsis dalmanni]